MTLVWLALLVGVRFVYGAFPDSTTALAVVGLLVAGFLDAVLVIHYQHTHRP